MPSKVTELQCLLILQVRKQLSEVNDLLDITQLGKKKKGINVIQVKVSVRLHLFPLLSAESVIVSSIFSLIPCHLILVVMFEQSENCSELNHPKLLCNVPCVLHFIGQYNKLLVRDSYMVLFTMDHLIHLYLVLLLVLVVRMAVF